MVRFFKIWRVLTVLALIFWILLSVMVVPELIEARSKGWHTNDDSMINTFAPEAYYFKYSDAYEMMVTATHMLLLFILTCIVSFCYQNCVIRKQSLIPDGKLVLPLAAAVLHIMIVASIFMIN